MTDIIEDIEIGYEAGGKTVFEKAHPADAAKQPGATFRSVFGRGIATSASVQQSIWASRGWSDRDKDAALPVALAASILDHTRKPEANGLIGNPGEEQAERDLREAKAFAQAYQRQTGVELIRQGQVSAHEELRMMTEAEEFAETGICEYVENARSVELEYRHAERNRQHAQRKRVRQKGQRQMVL